MKNTKPTLANAGELLALRDNLGIDADDETVLALAERAAARGDNPPALLRWMLTHAESWNWLTDQDLARARSRLEEPMRLGKTTKKQTYSDWRALRLDRPQRSLGRPAATTGWQTEAELIAKMHDERLRRRERQERWGRGIALATLAAMLVWLFW